jgi:hypothetical protein
MRAPSRVRLEGECMPISMWKRYSYACGLVAIAAIAAGAYGPTVHAGPSVRTVQLRDDCDPASFNAAVGPGTCVGGGDTAFPDFLAEVMEQGSADKWRFNPTDSEADQGVNTQNRGGETHSFTEVKHFGGGFIEVLNGGMEPLDECAARAPDGTLIRDQNGALVPASPAILTFVPAGTSSPTKALKKGTHIFQCCIHPWMHTTLVVR